MSEWIVQTKDGAVLLGGGAVDPADLLGALSLAPVLVAADGGANRAHALGLEPHAVIGDMDSLSDQARAAFGPERIHRIAEQDSTDFGKCLAHVQARFLLALGFAGLRLDHTLAALSNVARHRGAPLVMISEEDVIFRLPPEVALDLPLGARISLFPFGPVTGRSEGLRWPIDGITLAPDDRVGTSNEVSGPVRIETRGSCLCLLPKAHLGAVLAALGV